MKEKLLNKDFKDMTWDEFDKHTQMLIEKVKMKQISRISNT